MGRADVSPEYTGFQPVKRHLSAVRVQVRGERGGSHGDGKRVRTA